MVEINLKKSKLKFASWIQPHPGGVALTCSKCQGPDFEVHGLFGQFRCNNCHLKRFAVHADMTGKDSASVHEIVCTGCLTQTKLDLGGQINGTALKGLECAKCHHRRLLEPGAVIDRRGNFINQPSKRIINDESTTKDRGRAG